jgi:hypothetical protein
MVILGNTSMQLQPGASVDEDENGLLSGECVWIGDYANRYSAGQKGSLHPHDSRLTAYRSKLTKMATGKCSVTVGYIGLAADPTPMFIEYPGGSGQEPIETHPNFAQFAGTPAAPLNGAKFEATGEFIGFASASNAEKLNGTRSYIVPSVTINLTYYTHRVPNVSRVGKKYTGQIPDLIKPPNVKDFLLIGLPYKKIGNLFQVTLQILGSGEDGWNQNVY